jgi:SAM-dependent methyltransferase
MMVDMNENTSVTRHGMDQQPSAIQASYDRIAAEYAARFRDELVHKPLDRALLNCFAELVRGYGPVGDVGCGPGQVARYLHERGLDIVGIDLSPAMVALARQHHPGLTFRQGTMLALDVPAEAWAGLVAFYSIIHLPPDAVVQALAEFHRVLRPGGRVLLAFHLGEGVRHVEEWWGHPVALDAYFFERTTVESWLEHAGFAIEAYIERQPYVTVEVATQRAYLLARKPPTEHP